MSHGSMPYVSYKQIFIIANKIKYQITKLTLFKL